MYKILSCFIANGLYIQKEIFSTFLAFLHELPVHISTRRYRPAFFLKELKLVSVIGFTSFTAKLSLFAFEAFRVSVMSSFFIIFKSSFRYEIIVALKRWGSVQHWHADIELVMEAIPVP